MTYSEINLHTHTTASDGAYTVAQLIDIALAHKVKVIAITDHDTIDGLEHLNTIPQTNIKVIPGIEFSAKFDRHYHILGYFRGTNLPIIWEATSRLKNARKERALALVENLKNRGYPVDFEEVQSIAGGDSSIGKPHIARILVDKGFASNLDEVFESIFPKIQIPDRFKFTAREIIDMIHKSGGIAVIAHPKTLNYSKPDFEAFLREQINNGIDGIEVFYPTHTLEEIYYYKELADRYGLLKTAGGDFHGYNGPSQIAEVALIKPFDIWAGF